MKDIWKNEITYSEEDNDISELCKEIDEQLTTEFILLHQRGIINMRSNGMSKKQKDILFSEHPQYGMCCMFCNFGNPKNHTKICELTEIENKNNEQCNLEEVYGHCPFVNPLSLDNVKERLNDEKEMIETLIDEIDFIKSME